MKNYDITVIGGGPGGYVAAIKASQLGAKVALIENHKLGGVCLNSGCIPTKSYLKSAKIFKDLNKSADFGIKINGTTDFDWRTILLRKNRIVKQLTNGVSYLLTKNNVDIYQGFGEALDAKNIKVNNQLIQTNKLIIATGASTFIPPIKGIEESLKKGFAKTSKELLELEVFPKKIIIIGGGVIGIEFATIFNTFGSKVIILERQSEILNTLDHDIIQACRQTMQKNMVEILNNIEINHIENNKISYLHNNKLKEDDADVILIATGYKPNLLGLEKLNLKIDRYAIITDNFLRTSVEDVYAIGDANGKHMLAHVASHEGITAVHHALDKNYQHGMNYNRIPSCIYSFPEIASIGLTELQAKDNKIDYKVSKIPLVAVGKALADGEQEGFTKLIINKKYSEIIGMHIYAYNATELISEIAVAMELEGTVHELAHAIHPHPTLSELTLESYLGAINKPIHFYIK